MSNVHLVTGGAGNLACQLSFELARRGARVVLFDVAEQPAAPVADGCQYICGDLTADGALAEVIDRLGPEVIIHFASLLSGSCERDRRRGWRVNMDGAFELFEAALASGVKKVLFPSSVAAYGGELPEPLPEDYPQWPGGLYGVTKMAVERLGVYYQQRHGIDFRCLRVPIVVSRYAPPGAASAYVSRAFVEAVELGRFIFRVAPQTRAAAIYIEDILRAMVMLLDAPEARLTRRVYNIHGLAPSAAELRDAIVARLPDAKITFETDPQVAALIGSWPATIIDESAQRDWGWSPQFDLPALADHFIRSLRP